ncbi:hypothetical protein KGF54_003140 [Candida jiufengensis]|uniref:uncharacterized protein n=1 Tax=Candida jiufengensis TaxID=497108 RepID=UPI002225B3BE|nr:uncharacterized protein KGF54_003140 [Candida jiufengensis]KAI5952274.1 hypothetical protein KGF54_003140 [Candida jiufengensis]
MTTELIEPEELQFTKVIAVLLNSRNYQFSETFLKQITELATRYLNTIIFNLLEYTQLQRRKQPSISDINILLKLHEISSEDLFEEVLKSKKFQNHQQIKQILNSKQKPFDYTESSLPFFQNEHYAITNVVPNLKVKPNYIPHYLPDLPPDYTYQSTDIYSEPLTDLKELRIKLVEESRLTEKALYKLIENDEVESNKKLKFENELKELLQKQKSIKEVLEEDPQPKEPKITKSDDRIIEIPNDKAVYKFDFIEYAKKRKLMTQKKQKQAELKRQKRDQNIFIKAETYYSPYATKSPTLETNEFFTNILNKEFKNVIVSIRSNEFKKKEQKRIQKELKVQKEKEFRQQNEIQFNFQNSNSNGFNNNSDIDSDDMDDF